MGFVGEVRNERPVGKRLSGRVTFLALPGKRSDRDWREILSLELCTGLDLCGCDGA